MNGNLFSVQVPNPSGSDFTTRLPFVSKHEEFLFMNVYNFILQTLTPTKSAQCYGRVDYNSETIQQ